MKTILIAVLLTLSTLALADKKMSTIEMSDDYHQTTLASVYNCVPTKHSPEAKPLTIEWVLDGLMYTNKELIVYETDYDGFTTGEAVMISNSNGSYVYSVINLSLSFYPLLGDRVTLSLETVEPGFDYEMQLAASSDLGGSVYFHYYCKDNFLP